ncbi:hypothetical protein HPB51_005603 [Rhipicephalus microplus]|uniref:Uncharacterized protein n=1 Tax=Rhipicephalus microplus TaxID=6941 RepID=A0A9J6DTE4_RHIMP|nr:hypothetical protein HPB51_005603 [Rhipicephalus microplus]
MLKLYYMDTEGSLYISRITSDVRKVVKKVTQYLKETHGLQPQPMQIPEMRFAVFTLFKVAAAKEPQPLSEMYRPGGFNTLVELFRLLVGAGRHTLAALVTCKMASLFRFRSEQEGEALVASLENARDRFEEKLGDNGVLVLPAATSAALFRNQDVLIFDSPDTVTLFNLFQAPATVCPVMRQLLELRSERRLRQQSTMAQEQAQPNYPPAQPPAANPSPVNNPTREPPIFSGLPGEDVEDSLDNYDRVGVYNN